MAQMINDYYYATGRRKCASARVFLKPGQGATTINGKDWREYFGADTIWENQALLPLRAVKQESAFDIKVTVTGGGIKGQAGAVAHGIARALDYYATKHDSQMQLKDKLAAIDSKSPEEDASDDASSTIKWHKVLREAGLLTRDPRRVYRKKVGLVKSRKAKQFSKR